MDRLGMENALIGAILIDPRCLGDIRGILKVDHLALETNKAIFRAAVSLDRQGKAVDPVIIRNETKKRGEEVPAEYILQLMDMTPTAANAVEYAQQVREQAMLRGLSSLADGMKRSVEEHCTSQEITGAAMNQLEQLTQDGVGGVLLSPEDLALRFYQHRERVDKGEHSAFVPTGYRMLDMRLGGGMLASGVYVLAGRPGMGKSTLALNIADHVAKDIGPVLFVSLEMNDEQLTAKRLSRETGIPGDRLLMDRLTDEEYAKVSKATDKITPWPFYANHEAAPTVEEIHGMARAVKGLKLVVIDYFGKVNPGHRGKWGSRVEYTTELSGAIKDLARALRVPVLLLAQLNRESEKRGDHRPLLSDLRDTGAVEQDADGVMLLYRDAYYGDRAKRDPYMPEEIHVDIAKNRHGNIGECTLAFYLGTSKVVPVTQDPREEYRQRIQSGQE